MSDEIPEPNQIPFFRLPAIRYVAGVLVGAIPIIMLLPLSQAIVLKAVLFVVWMIAFVVATGILSRNSNPSSGTQTEVKDEEETLGMLIVAEGLAKGEEKKALQSRLTLALNSVQEADGDSLSIIQLEFLYAPLNTFARLKPLTPRDSQWSGYPLGGTWEKPKVLTAQSPKLSDDYVDFLLAVLKALEKIGDQDTFKPIEALLQSELETEQVERLQQAAVQCLAAINRRIEARYLAHTLVRPSDVPVDPLLRPAQTTSSTQPEVLLRPNANQDDLINHGGHGEHVEQP